MTTSLYCRRWVAAWLTALLLAAGCREADSPTSLPADTPAGTSASAGRNTPTATSTEIRQLPATVAPTRAPRVTATVLPATPALSACETEDVIAFIGSRDGEGTAYTIRSDGTDLTRLSIDTAIIGLPQWAPDGTKLAYISMRIHVQALLFVLDLRSGQTTVVRPPRPILPEVGGFSWSPDSQKLVFTNRSDFPPYRLYWVSTTDWQVHLLSADQWGAWDLQWSPTDPETIAIATKNGIALLNLDGSRRDFPAIGQPIHISWSPSGQQIAYSIRPDPALNSAIYVVGVDGEQGQALMQNQAGESADWPQWSPAGNMLAYISSPFASNDSVYIMDLASGSTINVSASLVDSQYPGWSSNGKCLAFLSRARPIGGHGYALNVYSLETGQIRQIVDEFVEIYPPVWWPGSR